MRQGNFEALDHSRGRPVSLVLLLTLGVLKQEELLRGGTAQKGGPEASGTSGTMSSTMGEARTELGGGGGWPSCFTSHGAQRCGLDPLALPE